MLAEAGVPPGLAVEWSDGEVEWERLLPEWHGLVEGDPDASLFQTPEWVTAWWRHLGGGRLRFLAVRRGGRLVAFVPLVERRESVYGVAARVLAIVGEPEADRLGVLADPAEPDALAAAAGALAGAVRSVDVLRLAEVATGSRLEEAVERAAAMHGIPAARTLCTRAPILALDRPWATIEAEYPRALRTRLRRARQHQQQAGGLTFRRWQPRPEELPRLLDRFRDLEQRSWKGERGTGIFSTPARWGFFVDLSAQLARRGWLDVATLESGERLVAYRYGFRFRGSFLDYNLAHDPADDRLSPGRVLLDDVVRDSHRLGLAAVDASRGRLDPPHLLADWTSASRWHARWMLFGPSARGRLLSLAERRLRPALRRMRGLREPGEESSR